MKEKIINFFKKIYSKLKTSQFWKDKYSLAIIIINFLLNIILWIIIFIKFRSLEIPLYNPIASSFRFLVQRGKGIYSLPIIGLFISLVNIFLAQRMFNNEKFLSYLLLGISLFVQVMLLITLSVYLLI